MPFITKPFSEDEDDKLKNQLSSTSVGLSPQGNQVPVSNGKPKASGSFTNLEKYINANKDQSQELASAVADKVTSIGNEARDSFASADSSFKNKVNSSTISNLDTAFSDAKSTVDKTVLGSYSNDPDLARFKEVTTASYKGPENLEASDYYADAQAKNEKVKNYSNLSDSETGRGQLLNDIYKRPDYTAGQNTFDNLLLGGTEANKQKLATARQDVSDVDGAFQSLLKNSSDYATQVKDKTDSMRQNSVDYFKGQQSSENKKVDDRISSVKSNWNNDYNYYRELLNSSNGGKNLALSSTEMDKLGVTEQQRLYNVLKDVDASAYLKQNTFDANKNITKDEQAKLAALDILAKQFDGNLLNKYTNAEIAETQNIQDALDASGFGQELNTRDKLFNDYAKQTNLRGSGSASEGIMESDWTGNRSSIGTAYASTSGNILLDDYLKGSGIKYDTNAYVDSGAGQRDGELDRSIRYARNQAAAQIFQQIDEIINASGYKNQVQRKK